MLSRDKIFCIFNGMGNYLIVRHPYRLILGVCFILSTLIATGCGKQSGEKKEATQSPVTLHIPAAPQNTKALIGDAQAIITWDGVPNATQYNLYIATESGVTPQSAKTLKDGNIISGVTSPYTLSNLKNGVTYYIAITAANTAGESKESTELAIAPQAPLPIPGTPQEIKASSGIGKVTLSWEQTSDADHYNIYVAAKSDFDPEKDNIFEIGKKYQASTNQLTIDNLQEGQPYYFVVTAENAAGESIASKEILAQSYQPLSAPVKFQAKSGDEQIQLSWNSVKGSTEYNLYMSTKRSLNKENFKSLKGVEVFDGVKSPYTLSGLTNGVKYYFLVTAKRADSEGPSSERLASMPAPTVAIPSMPTRLKAVAANDQVTLSWDPVRTAASYNIYIAASSAVTPKNYQTLEEGRKIEQVTSPYVIGNLKSGVTYFAIVTAVNKAGEGDPSIFASASPTGAEAAKAVAQAEQPALLPIDPNLLKLDFSGKPIRNQQSSFNEEKWQCVLNKKTGLMWEVKTNDGSLRDKRRTFSWFITPQNAPIMGGRSNIGQLGIGSHPTAVAKIKVRKEDLCKGADCDLSTYIHSVNRQRLCGYSDWRLPTRQEMRTLIDKNKTYPAPMINTNYFPNAQNSYYWTGSQDAYNNQAAWFVNFTSGYEYYDIKSNPLYVRLVRSEQAKK